MIPEKWHIYSGILLAKPLNSIDAEVDERPSMLLCSLCRNTRSHHNNHRLLPPWVLIISHAKYWVLLCSVLTANSLRHPRSCNNVMFDAMIHTFISFMTNWRYTNAKVFGIRISSIVKTWKFSFLFPFIRKAMRIKDAHWKYACGIR